jgi:CBS domain containing-hemolysin-like protein
VGEEIADLLDNGEAPTEELFDRRERVMISGVLQLAERPIRTLMTVRADVDHIDLDDDAEAIRTRLMHSSYSRRR